MKTLNLYLEERFIYFNNHYYSQIYGDSMWAEYLEVFDKVFVIARVKKQTSFDPITKGYKITKNPNIIFIPLADYQGLYEGIKYLPATVSSVVKSVKQSQSNLLRLPGLISNIAGVSAIWMNKNIAVQLVGDPYDVFSSGVGGKYAPVLKIVFTNLTKYICKNAAVASYVTQYTLQEKYPPNRNAVNISYSDVNLEPSVFEEKNIRKDNIIEKEVINFLMVGSLEQRYKGFDIALRAISQLKTNKKFTINIVGEGIYLEELKELVRELNLSEVVNFCGKVSHEEVLRLMVLCDIFLMPSRTEGLPRALIEAMAMGAPAIGSNVGGIPELLDREFIFTNENYSELSKMILKLINSSEINQISKSNMNKVLNYRKDRLTQKKQKFYQAIAKLIID